MTFVYYLEERTVHGSARIYVRLPVGQWIEDYEATVLNELCCWNGYDKHEVFSDGSAMLSWELPLKNLPAIERLLEVWKLRRGWQHTTDFNKVYPSRF